jgi:intracellular sulfur oxidation DsrE/DsrF family protein
MSRQLQLLLALCFAMLCGLAPPAVAAEKAVPGKAALATKNKMVFQISDEDVKKWNGVLGNIRNIQAELGAKNVSIAVVLIGYGLGMVTVDSLSANGVQDALATGVEFVACGNSMKAQHVTKEDLVEGVKTSTSGYVELMRRQQQGWSYFKP